MKSLEDGTGSIGVFLRHESRRTRHEGCALRVVYRSADMTLLCPRRVRMSIVKASYHAF